MKRFIFPAIFIALFTLLATGVYSTFLSPRNTAHAASSSDWQASDIIDDALFYNNNAMSTQDIQNFLNQKVPTCDTNGTQMYNSTITDAQYAASQGWPGPAYVCLKDYYQVPRSDQIVSNLSTNVTPSGAISAAQIIKNAADTYGINPQVLLVTIQKESLNLLNDNWPLPSQYISAMGYGCPDTAPCDPQYAGFYNQMMNSARQFQLYKNNPSSYRYKYLQNNTILYNPSTSCGSSTVYISSQATAGLYNYTPYQPNQSAINNLYGNGDSCSSYGNRNFWRTFTDWFGPSTSSHLRYSVIQGPNSSNLYLQTSAGKYYISDSTVMANWGINNLPVQQVTQAYLDSLTSGPLLGSLLKDDWNNYFIVENGTLHYVRDQSYLALWGINQNSAVQSLGLVYSLKSGSWAGRFVQDSMQPSGSIWVVDGGKKHLINSNQLYDWRYTPDQLTSVSATFLGDLPTSSPITQYAVAASNSYIIDSGRKLSFPNADIQNAYYGSVSAVSYDANTLSYLPTEEVSQFVINSTNGQWFMLENGKKHYISSFDMANVWGKSSNTALTTVSTNFLSNLVNGGTLTNVVQTTSPSQYWVIDQTKHYIPNVNIANAWLTNAVSPPVYSNQSIDMLKQGQNATTTLNISGSSYVYEMDAGTRHYLSTANSLDAFGGVMFTVSSSLINTIPEGAFLNYIAKDSSNNAYLFMANQRYQIDPNYFNEWNISTATPILDITTIARYPLTAQTVRSFVTASGKTYVLSNGAPLLISTYLDAYQPATSLTANLPKNYFLQTVTQATYIVKSSNTQDQNYWLISSGIKYPLNGFAGAVSYGYISSGIVLTTLNPSTIASFTQASANAGLFIRTSSSFGIKLVNFGTSLGFPDSPTLSAFLGSSTPLIVSDSIYNSIPLTGSVSQAIRDDSGKIYLIDSGTKKWVATANAYNSYVHYPISYLYGTSIVQIPDGATLN
jgi:hypothetical protein